MKETIYSYESEDLKRFVIPLQDFIKNGIDAAYSTEGPLIKAIIYNELEVPAFNTVEEGFDRFKMNVYTIDSKRLEVLDIERSVRKNLWKNCVYTTKQGIGFPMDFTLSTVSFSKMLKLMDTISFD